MKRIALALLLLVSAASSTVRAYVDATPSLGRVIRDAVTIVVLRVEKVSKERRAIIYRPVATLKGESSTALVKHQLMDGAQARATKIIFDEVEPGKTAVCFHNGKIAYVCLGAYWYECSAATAPWWRMTRGLPEMALAYFGSTRKLAGHVQAIRAGREVVITAVTHDSPGGCTYEAVAFKSLLRGPEYPIWRIRAILDMPGNVYHTGADPRFVAGYGAGDGEDVPALLEALRDTDVQARAEAADAHSRGAGAGTVGRRGQSRTFFSAAGVDGSKSFRPRRGDSRLVEDGSRDERNRTRSLRNATKVGGVLAPAGGGGAGRHRPRRGVRPPRAAARLARR